MKKITENLAESLALDYCERVRSYGDEAADLVDVDSFLCRLPNDAAREEFLELVNLDLLATAVGNANAQIVEIEKVNDPAEVN